MTRSRYELSSTFPRIAANVVVLVTAVGVVEARTSDVRLQSFVFQQEAEFQCLEFSR